MANPRAKDGVPRPAELDRVGFRHWQEQLESNERPPTELEVKFARRGVVRLPERWAYLLELPEDFVPMRDRHSQTIWPPPPEVKK